MKGNIYNNVKTILNYLLCYKNLLVYFISIALVSLAIQLLFLMVKYVSNKLGTSENSYAQTIRLSIMVMLFINTVLYKVYFINMLVTLLRGMPLVLEQVDKPDVITIIIANFVCALILSILVVKNKLISYQNISLDVKKYFIFLIIAIFVYILYGFASAVISEFLDIRLSLLKSALSVFTLLVLFISIHFLRD